MNTINDEANARIETWGEVYRDVATDEILEKVYNHHFLRLVDTLFPNNCDVIKRDIASWEMVSTCIPNDEKEAAFQSNRNAFIQSGQMPDRFSEEGFPENAFALLVLELSVYASCGLRQETWMSESEEAELEVLRGLVENTRATLSALPKEWLSDLTPSSDKDDDGGEKPPFIAHICNLPLIPLMEAAEARFRLDTNAPMSKEGLALLAGVKTKSVLNAASSGTLEVTAENLVAHHSAVAFLQGRKGWLPSIWREVLRAGADECDDDTADFRPTVIDEPVMFVPCAKDGSAFLPDLRAPKGYQIGAKGSEAYVDDYFEALSALSHMDVPRWRRPSASGVRSLVSASSWDRVTRADLVSLVEKTERR